MCTTKKLINDEYKEMEENFSCTLFVFLWIIGSCIACSPFNSKRECCFFVTCGDALWSIWISDNVNLASTLQCLVVFIKYSFSYDVSILCINLLINVLSCRRYSVLLLFFFFNFCCQQQYDHMMKKINRCYLIMTINYAIS